MFFVVVFVFVFFFKQKVDILSLQSETHLMSTQHILVEKIIIPDAHPTGDQEVAR